MKEIWRCPKCKAEAEIRGNTKRIRRRLDPLKATEGFPSHRDCELAKPIKRMDFSKLERVREE